METVCQELGIPRKQIRQTKRANRYVVIVHKAWLKCLSQQQSLAKFPVHPGFDEWPLDVEHIGQDWSLTYFAIYRKHNHKVIPLPSVRKDINSDSDLIASFGHLLQHISSTNHRNAWKNAYSKYSMQRTNVPTKDTINRTERNTVNLVAYDSVLLESIIRTYRCNVLHAKLDKIITTSSDSTHSAEKKSTVEHRYDTHSNLYPITGCIETTTHYVLVYGNYLANSLADCITYSPAILDKSYNKPLFIIYQLLQLIKTLHDRGLFLGNIGLDDIYVTENLWLQVMPQLNLNILRSTDQTHDAQTNQLINLTKIPGDNMPSEIRWSLRDYCTMWCNGELSNFDYLSILNNLSGRRIGDPSFHHIMPWVTDFISRGGLNWRDLTKSKYRLNKGDTQLDLMFVPPPNDAMRNMNPHHVSDVLSEITYYVYTARRTPKSVLCKHVRPIWVPHEYPISIARLYNWTPDECIPEFFSDPLVFKSIHEDLPDLEIPSWSSCPEDFITKHREALESQYVSERLHYWIDLNFGYKLTGNAAIKSKNVYLSMVDNHQNLCRRGIVQLFNHPHPPRQYQTVWTAKAPPRIYSQSEMRRRLTRSTDDLTNKLRTEELSESTSSGQATHSRHSPSLSATATANTANSINNSTDEAFSSIERSPSLHSNVHRSTNRILLPRDYNPIAALTAVENMNIFLSKTFYSRTNDESTASIDDTDIHNVEVPITDEGINAFTNRIFAERFEEGHVRDSKRLHNHKNYAVQNSTRNFRQIIAEHRQRELKVLGCIVVELFLANKLRPINGIGATSVPSLGHRISACQNVLNVEIDALPKCVRYPVQLLFDDSTSSYIITDLGLPKPTANQLLQLFLSNFLFPFPHEYLTVYTLLKSLYQYDRTNQLLDLHTYFECDGSNCRRFVSLDKQRTLFRRKIAECKVMAGAAQLESILIARGFEQFNVIDLVWPNVVELITADGTAILAAWFLFDSIATALGPYRTKQHLLEPILKLYDAESVERVAFLNSNMDATIKFTTGAAFKSRKTIKLYHHSFLLRLIVRFGLKCFLDNFVPPLIEAIGGYKEPVHHSYYHYHDNIGRSDVSFKANKNIKMCVDLEGGSFTHKLAEEEMFAFDADVDEPQKPLHSSQADSSDNDVDGLSHIMDHFDLNTTDESVIDIQLNHSNALEVTEETSEEIFKSIEIPTKTERRQNDSVTSGRPEVVSPTIAIPSSSKQSQLNTINCDIGSKISTDEADLLEATMSAQANDESASSIVSPIRSSNASDSQTQYQISDMSAESIIWLSHRLGPVLTARHLTRNLLKMLTLCYMGQENLMPDISNVADNSRLIHDNLVGLSIADGRVTGDRSAVKVLECLTSVSSIYGDHFILLQYFSHITELIALCKKRITASLEGGLISSLQMLKYIVPCLSDSVIMDQLHDTILKSIIHPIIRFIGSTRFLMPNGFLARSVLARKLLDAIYVLAVRIGPEMTKSHLCVPALQRFFLIFDKSHGIADHLLNDPSDDLRGSPSFDDSSFIEIRRDGGTKEWSVKGSPIQIRHARTKDDNAVNSITPPKQDEDVTPIASYRERALEEIKEVFTPQLAHVSYVPFLKFLGDHIMKQFMKNLPLILTLCHEYEQPEYASLGHGIGKSDSINLAAADVSYTDGPSSGVYSSSFGTTMIGNRIGVHIENESTEIGPMEILDLVSHKFDQINVTRHLRGNWLAYWEHEIGRPEKNAQFNVKQIKLQTYAGHTNSVRSMLCLDNENSFMSASKDKTVKLWSLRSEGDGSKVSSCQFTYANHRKSVHSLAFLEALRLTVSCDSSVHIWDPFVGSEIGQLDSARLPPVSVVKTYPAPSALILAGTADSTLRIIDARTVSYVNEWKLSMVQASASVRCIAVAPSGKWVAVALSSGQISLCDGQTGILIATWKHTDGELLQLIALNEDQIISTSLDHSVCVWSTLDGTLMYQLKNPNEPIHVLLCNQNELIFGTPANRIGVYSSIQSSSPYSITKLRTETIKGVLTSMAILPLNRMLLVGGDSGMISLVC